MSDPDARFARKLAASAGRLDWWNVYDEHTPAEWSAQIAQFNSEPWGEDRDDLRAAVMTAALMSMQCAKPPTDEEFGKWIDDLRSYLPVHRYERSGISEFERDPRSMQAIAAMKGT